MANALVQLRDRSATSISVGGQQFDVDEDGQAVVPLHLAEQLQKSAPHRYKILGRMEDWVQGKIEAFMGKDRHPGFLADAAMSKFNADPDLSLVRDQHRFDEAVALRTSDDFIDTSRWTEDQKKSFLAWQDANINGIGTGGAPVDVTRRQTTTQERQEGGAGGGEGGAGGTSTGPAEGGTDASTLETEKANGGEGNEDKSQDPPDGTTDSGDLNKSDADKTV